MARLGRRDQAASARRDAARALAHLRATGRAHEALVAGAGAAALHEGREPALAQLDSLLDIGPPSHLGWSMPLEPALRPLHGHPGFARTLARLADRAK